MRVELIEDEEPRRCRIGGDGLRDMARKVFFRSAWSDGRRHNFPRRHVKIGDQTLRPVTQIFLLGALDRTWSHRQGGGSPLQRLYPSLLIRTDDMPTALGDLRRVLVHHTHGSHFGGTCHGVIRLGVEPVVHPMRLSIGLILKNARHCEG